MREMILNHASLAPLGWHDTLEFLPGLADGMAGLVRDGAAQATLRMSQSLHETRWRDEGSLFNAFLEIKRRGARDQSLFLLKLSERAPLLSGLGPDVTDRFQRCEATMLPPNDGAPLVLCAITDAIAVGFPSEPVWDRDRLRIEFLEVLEDGASFEDAQEDIDNLARAEHAVSIIDRRRDRLRLDCSNTVELWDRREELFPQLSFGLDVEEHLAELNPGLLSALVKKLADLHDSAVAWPGAGGAEPPWTCRVTDESESVKKNPKFRDARQFPSAIGEPLHFLWHARFGDAKRIHLRFDASKCEIEIGYVGPHLPTKRFPK